MLIAASLSPNVWALAGAQLLVGFVFGNTGVMLAMLADVTPSKRLGMAVGIVSAAFPIGSSVGPLLGGYVAQTFGIRPLLFGDGVASALVGLLLTVAVREGPRHKISDASVTTMLRQSARDILASRLVAGIFVAYFLSVLTVFLYTQLLPIVLQRLFRGPESALPALIGDTLAAFGVVMAVTTPLWGRLGDAIGRWRTLPIILLSMTIGVAALSFATTLTPLRMAIVGVGLVQGGVGATTIALLAYLAEPDRRASILNFSLLPSQLSWFIGPLIGGALASISLRIPFYLAVAVQGAALLFAISLARRARVAQPPNASIPSQPVMTKR